MPDHEVVIVGAGPVGLLLACLLAQRGKDVLVLERRGGAGTRSRAIGIHPPGLDALDRAGIGDRIRAEALALESGEVRSRGRRLASLAFDPARPILTLAQPRTDALLRERLTELAPGALTVGHAVRSVRDEGGEVRMRVDGDAGGERLITAAVVVAADGVRSGIRQDLGIGWRRRPGAAAYAMVDVDDAGSEPRAVLFCEPTGLVESLPLPGSRRRWVLRLDAPRADPITAAELRAEIEHRTGVRPAIGDDSAPVSFTASQHEAREVVRGRIALVGDAAHEISPIGGQGMNLGWVGTSILAEALSRSPSDRMPDLRRFDRTVRRSRRRAQRRSAFYMAMGETASGVPLVMRDALIRTLGAPPMRDWTTGLLTMRGI